MFPSVGAFRKELREYPMKEGVNFVKIINEKTRLIVKCKIEYCSFKVYASC